MINYKPLKCISLYIDIDRLIVFNLAKANHRSTHESSQQKELRLNTMYSRCLQGCFVASRIFDAMIFIYDFTHLLVISAEQYKSIPLIYPFVMLYCVFFFLFEHAQKYILQKSYI